MFEKDVKGIIAITKNNLITVVLGVNYKGPIVKIIGKENPLGMEFFNN